MLTDIEVKALKPKAKRYDTLDSRGLYLTVSPAGGKSWLVRYQFNGKPQNLTLGKYPDVSIKDARLLRDEALAQVARGVSPAKQKKLAKAEITAGNTVETFLPVFMAEVQEKDRKDNKQFLRYFTNDILPTIGSKLLKDVTAEDIRTVIWKKKDQGFDSAAHQIRTALKKLFDYALTKGLVPFNPVLALPARHIFKPKSRDRYLTAQEVAVFLKAVYSSNIRRQFKLALHLSLITMARKNELLTAEWVNIDLDQGTWLITQEQSKTGAPLLINLPTQAVKIFEELKALAGGSYLVLPGRSSLDKGFAHNSLNNALKRSLIGTGLPAFNPHDLRRTAATLLSENGWHSDIVDAALNHRMKGVRGTYNKAEFVEQRKEMLSFWAAFLDSKLNAGNVYLLGAA